MIETAWIEQTLAVDLRSKVAIKESHFYDKKVILFWSVFFAREKGKLLPVQDLTHRSWHNGQNFSFLTYRSKIDNRTAQNAP